MSLNKKFSSLIYLSLVLSTACASSSVVEKRNSASGESFNFTLPVDSDSLHSCELMPLIVDRYFFERHLTKSLKIPDDFPIKNEHRTVLTDKGLGNWRDHISEANILVIKYLAKIAFNYSDRLNGKVRFIIHRFRYHYVQYIYNIEPRYGKEMIEMNFFFVVPPNDCEVKESGPPSYWKTKYYDSRGGGTGHWRAYFDIEDRMIDSIDINTDM